MYMAVRHRHTIAYRLHSKQHTHTDTETEKTVKREHAQQSGALLSAQVYALNKIWGENEPISPLVTFKCKLGPSLKCVAKLH